MSKEKTVIIVRNPNSDLPEAYLRKVLSECPSCGGYAVQTKDSDGNPTIVSDRMETGVELESVQELLKGFPDDKVLLAFSKLDNVKENVLQPFDMLAPDGSTPLLSFALEGDFPSMVEEGTTSSANFSKKVLLPNLAKFLKYSDGDLDKFLTELRDETFVDSIMARIGDRGQFVFLPPIGDAIWYGKNKLHSFFPWGQVSNTLEYTEKAPEKPVEEVTEKKKGWWSSNKSKPTLSLPVAEEKVEPKPAVPERPEGLPAEEEHVVKDPGKTESVPQDTTQPPKGEWKEVPRNLSKKDRKSFIRRVTGCGNNLPDGWEKLDFKYWEVSYPSAAKELRGLQEKFNTQPKDMRQPEPKPSPTKGSEVITEANAMVLTSEEKSAAETAMLKIMDRSGKKIPDPAEIQKMEEKYPTFTKQFGVTLEQIESWTPRDIEVFAKENGKAFFHMFLEVRRACIAAKPAKVETPVEEKIEEPKKANSNWSSWGKK